MSDDSCQTCRFWRLTEPAERGRGPWGHCCRLAPRGPVPPDAAPFATTAATQWCAEHEDASWPGRLAQMEREEAA